ncbi:hypothetical protein WJX84_006439 [Apatococcus fuscideae]|uniref:OB domain-containing protein n=1 Tax=Apatococcus fuscideae TaxID=2026836 RepID=A0AAW1SM44_9CHLO
MAGDRSLGASLPGGRTAIKSIKGGSDGGKENVGKEYTIRGWVRTARKQKAFSFIEVNDGSTLSGLQVVVNPDCEGYSLIDDGQVATGASVAVVGELTESPGGRQKVELKASKLQLLGACDASTYPLQKKKHTLEFLRTIAHLRPRTNTMGAVMRVRSALAFATHLFFRQRGFQ